MLFASTKEKTTGKHVTIDEVLEDEVRDYLKQYILDISDRESMDTLLKLAKVDWIRKALLEETENIIE
jgi:hypothetical protein